MRPAEFVEVTSVFPSPMGGAIFRGIRFGEKKVISFRASYKVISRVPKVSEFWKISGDEIYTNEYGVVVNVHSAALTHLPSSSHVGKLLAKHVAFRGISLVTGYGGTGKTTLLKAVFLLDPTDSNRLVNTICDLRGKIDALTLTSYSNERFVGATTKINHFLQETLNRSEGMALKLGSRLIRVDDPVITTVNVYALEIFNGMTGVVKSVQFNADEEMECNILFDGRERLSTLTQSQCWEVGLDLAYALTIHKAQGSEYSNGIICLSSRMERSALYTAVTRIKKLCIIVGNQTQFNDAVSKQPLYETIKCGFKF